MGVSPYRWVIDTPNVTGVNGADAIQQTIDLYNQAKTNGGQIAANGPIMLVQDSSTPQAWLDAAKANPGIFQLVTPQQAADQRASQSHTIGSDLGDIGLIGGTTIGAGLVGGGALGAGPLAGLFGGGAAAGASAGDAAATGGIGAGTAGAAGAAAAPAAAGAAGVAGAAVPAAAAATTGGLLSSPYVVSGLLGAAGSIGSSIVGAVASGNASAAQQAAAANAEKLNAPWVTAGTQSVGQLMQGFQNGTFGPGSIPPFTAPTAAEAAATPGYQFTQQQGERGVLAGAGANGQSLGGGTLKALDQYNTGLANSTYNDVFNRALTGYNAQLTGQQQSFNQLLGVSNQGESAANNVGNLMTQAGNAQAAGIVGQANAINSGITGTTSDISQAILLNKILGGQNTNAPSGVPNFGSAPGYYGSGSPAATPPFLPGNEVLGPG